MKELKGILVFFLGIALLLNSPGCGKSTQEKMDEAIDGSVQAAMLYNQQNYVRALGEIHRAITINTELKRDSALGENYILLALCQRKLGAYDSSLEAFRTSLEYFHLFGDQRLERRGRIALAELFYDLHRYQDALNIASAAAGEGKVFADSVNIYQGTLLVAKVNHKLRNYRKEASIIEELMNDPFSVRMIGSPQVFWRMLFDAARGLGDRDSIQSVFDRWRNSFSGGDSGSVTGAYVAWGRYQESLGNLDQALRAYSRALNLIGGRTQRVLQAEVLTSLGNLSFRGKRFDNARLYYTDALTIAKQESNIVLEQSLTLMIVACDWKLTGMKPNLQLSKELEKKCSDVAALCAQAAFLGGQSFAILLRGMIAERRSDSLAVASYREAANLSITNVIPSEEDRSVIDELTRVLLEGDSIGPHEPLVRLLCASGNTAEAFSSIEERNMRELEDFFSRLTFTPADPNLASAISEIRAKRSMVQLLQAEILEELQGGRERNLERFESLKDLLPQRLGDLASAVKAIDGSNYQWLLYPKRLTVQTVRSALPPHTGIVEYAATQNQVYSMLITADTVLLRSASVTKQHLLATIREYNGLIGDSRLTTDAPMFNAGSAMRRISELAPVLHSWLIEPVSSSFGALARIYVVPPAEFGFVPLHTLRSPGGAPVVTKIDISYLPTAAALMFSKVEEQPTREIVGFGHPGNTGWDVEYEVRDIRGFFDKARMYFDTTATLAHLSRVSCDLLHIAAPFVLSTDLPDSTGLILADGITPYGTTLVPLGKLMEISPPKTLVFSNINPVAGGLWRYAAIATLASGSQSVIYSLWQGERKAKKDFGEGYYTKLMEGSFSAGAFHDAIVGMTKNEETSRPHQWGLYFRFGR